MASVVEIKDKTKTSFSILDVMFNRQKKMELDKYCEENYEYIEEDDFAKKVFK